LEDPVIRTWADLLEQASALVARHLEEEPLPDDSTMETAMHEWRHLSAVTSDEDERPPLAPDVCRYEVDLNIQWTPLSYTEPHRVVFVHVWRSGIGWTGPHTTIERDALCYTYTRVSDSELLKPIPELLPDNWVRTFFDCSC
jgi:hypothetical protein